MLNIENRDKLNRPKVQHVAANIRLGPNGQVFDFVFVVRCVLLLLLLLVLLLPLLVLLLLLIACAGGIESISFVLCGDVLYKSTKPIKI